MKDSPFFEVIVRLNGVSVEGMMLLLTLVAERKSDYHMVVGPSDKGGKIQVRIADVTEWAAKNANLFVMDYTLPKEGSKWKIILRPMNSKDVDDALSAYQAYNAAIEYPNNYKVSLLTMKEIFSSIQKNEQVIELTQNNSEWQVRIERSQPCAHQSSFPSNP
jgi:hypothetical protein